MGPDCDAQAPEGVDNSQTDSRRGAEHEQSPVERARPAARSP